MKGKLISRLDHPTYISYGGQSIVVSPKSSTKIENSNKIGALPKGVIFVPDKK